MIRLIFVLRRQLHLSMADFQKYWRENHGPLVAKHGKALDILRYVQVHTIEDPLNDLTSGPRGTMKPYDGVAELWWASREALLAANSTPEGLAAARELLEDEKKFIDLANSPLWFAHEYPQVNPSPENCVAGENTPIIKLFYCIRHLPHLSLDEAQLYWHTTHGPKIRMTAQAARILRYVQVHRYEDEIDGTLRKPRGTQEEPFTGHAELWWERSELTAAGNTPEGRKAFAAALEDEKNFIDFSRSALWYAKEHVFIDRR